MTDNMATTLLRMDTPPKQFVPPPKVSDLPRVPLLNSPTPLELLPRLGNHFGGRKIYVKRDDLSGRGGGGNKLRKYERQLAQALDQGADTVVIAAHPQSNAARSLAGAAAACGLRCVIATKELIRKDTEAFRNNGNALLLNILGARLWPVPAEQAFPAALQQIALDLKREGNRPYVLPFGASDALGVLGYIDSALEIIAQMDALGEGAPALIAVSTGSGGTHAGLVAGIALSGCNTRVLGFSVLKPSGVAEPEVDLLAKQALDLLSLSEVKAAPATVIDSALGEGYGIPTPEALAAIRLLARLEGLLLCPVYTGKAMAGLLAYLEDSDLPQDAPVVFVHTGGLPLLFAYPDIFQGGAR